MNGGAPCFSASGRPSVHSVHSTVHAHITFKHGAKWGGERYRIGSMAVKFGKRQTAGLSGWLSSTLSRTMWFCGGCRRRGRQRRSSHSKGSVCFSVSSLETVSGFKRQNVSDFHRQHCSRQPSTEEVMKKYINKTTTSRSPNSRRDLIRICKLCLNVWIAKMIFYDSLRSH